jgi:diaminohydroxyphosphoribosylaminopyrimidine deaminase/5-amino-6-(5-phosphoribosylamino)uracil reductase
MQRAIDIASQGLSHTQSNPLVGCVIVYDNKIIAEGYHHKYGGDHAEIVALKKINDKEILKKSKMYVTLEPCSHYGKTPPCADKIISLQIPEVFIASIDPNPIVSGKGILKLKNAGISVNVGLLTDKYRFVNRRFFTFFEKKRPYIILKWAQSLDGFIAPSNLNNNEITWISNEFNKVIVHKWRSEEMAILVGSNTVKNDNPLLTVRYWKGNNPIRIVFQNEDKLKTNSNIFLTPPKTIRFTYNSNLKPIDNIITKTVSKDNFLNDVLDELFNMGILSVLVEGGTHTINSFIEKNLWDEARIITGNINFYSGTKAPSLTAKHIKTLQIMDNKISIVLNNL